MRAFGPLLVAVAILTAGCSLLESSNPDKPVSGQQAGGQDLHAVPVEVTNDILSINSNMQWVKNGRAAGPVRGKRGPAREETVPLGSDEVPVEGEATAENAAQAEAGAGAGAAGEHSPAAKSGGGAKQKYVVKSGDTLMKISFNHYGDVLRWREIYRANQAAIQDYNALVAGTVLWIEGVEYVVIDRNGKPYLIRKADTLGKISTKVYGVPAYWRELWHNNPQLIRNPNKIYAGFTLYYKPRAGAKPKLLTGGPLQRSSKPRQPSSQKISK